LSEGHYNAVPGIWQEKNTKDFWKPPGIPARRGWGWWWRQ